MRTNVYVDGFNLYYSQPVPRIAARRAGHVLQAGALVVTGLEGGHPRAER